MAKSGKKTSQKSTPALHPDDGPADNVLAYVHMLSDRIGRAFYPEIEARFGVTNHEWRVILTLHHLTGSTASEIANRWGMEKMAASRAIRRLEKDNIINRLQDTGDKRRFTLALTGKGRTLYDKIAPASNARYREIVSVLGKDELGTLRAVLARLIDQTGRLPKD